MSVPVHPEPVAGDEQTLRWVMPAQTLGFVGVPGSMPAVLAALLADGTLESVAVEPAAVRLRVGAGHSWRADGGRVRTALTAALADPAGWAAPADAAPGSVLRMAVQEVIDGEVGDYVRSHGGHITLLSVTDDDVRVRLGGACGHCPASELTLSERFETAVRAQYPAVRSVTADTGEVPTGRRGLGLSVLRR